MTDQDPSPQLEDNTPQADDLAHDQADDQAKTTAHPPLVLLVWLVGGILLAILIGPVLNLPAWLRGLGFIDVFGAFFIAAWAIGTFRRIGTDVSVNTPADKLAVDGPYAFSRNPIYLAMIALGVGLGIALSNIWLILGAVPFYYIIATRVIAPEETYLREKFGADYDAYCAKVRRWI